MRVKMAIQVPWIHYVILCTWSSLYNEAHNMMNLLCSKSMHVKVAILVPWIHYVILCTWSSLYNEAHNMTNLWCCKSVHVKMACKRKKPG